MKDFQREFKHHIVSLDLEMNQPSGQIIQIGAVMGDLNTGLVVDRFSVFVDPGEVLNQRIVNLTGIQHTDIDESGLTIDGAYIKLSEWLLPYASTRQLNPLTWGGNDAHELREQAEVSTEAWVFGRRHLDVKTVYAAWRHAQSKPGDGGLARSMTKLSLAFQGRKHNALDDAFNTFRMYVALKNRFGLGYNASDL